jgi:hypothetical protein
MRSILAAAAAAALFAAAAPGRHALAQLPGGPAGPKFEIAEARGLTEVPARPDTGFAASAPGPWFGSETRAVVVKFQASAPPKESDLSVVWIRQGGRTPTEVKSERVPAAELASGAYAMLTNGGGALAPGDYQVSVVGSGSRIYRTVQFTVAAATPDARPNLAAPGAGESASDDRGVALSPYQLEGLELRYPSSYAAIPHTHGVDHGVTFVRSVPRGALVLVVRKSGRYDLRGDTARLLRDVSKSLGTGGASGVETYDARELGQTDLGGRRGTGRLIVATLKGGEAVRLTLYATELFGKSALVGFVTPAAGKLSPGTVADPEQTTEDFFRLMQSIRPQAEAAPTKTDPPARERAKPAGALDIASSRP